MLASWQSVRVALLVQVKQVRSERPCARCGTAVFNSVAHRATGVAVPFDQIYKNEPTPEYKVIQALKYSTGPLNRIPRQIIQSPLQSVTLAILCRELLQGASRIDFAAQSAACDSAVE